MKTSRGFTLIELLVALTIVAILATLALPSFSGAIAKRKLFAVADEMQGHFYLAKAEALKTGKPVFIATSSSGANACYGFNVGAACDCSIAPGQPQACELARGRANSSVNMETNTFAQPAFIDPVRGAVTGAGRITWKTQDSQVMTVGITTVGRVYACANATGC